MKTQKQKGVDYSQLIIWSSALVGMIRYAAAFLSSDLGMITGELSKWVTFLLGFSGFFMGVLGTLGTTYIFDGWRQKMPATGAKWNNKFIALTVFVLAAFLTEIAILVPFTMSRVLHVSVADVLGGGVWWWSTAVVIMPLLLIGGVSLGNQIVTVTSESKSESFPKVSDGDQKVSEKFPSDWRKVLPFLSEQEIVNITQSSTSEIQAKYHLATSKTALNWRKYAQAEVLKIEAAKAKVEQ